MRRRSTHLVLIAALASGCYGVLEEEAGEGQVALGGSPRPWKVDPDGLIRHFGYYHSYGFCGDHVAAVKPMSNFVSIHGYDPNFMAKARQFRSEGLNVLLDVSPLFFGITPYPYRWYVFPDWVSYLTSFAPQLQELYNEGSLQAVFLCDECYGTGDHQLRRWDLEPIIGALHYVMPGIKVISVDIGVDAYRAMGVPAGLDVIAFDRYGSRSLADFNATVRRDAEWLVANTSTAIMLIVDAFDESGPITPEQQYWYAELAAIHPRIIGLWYFTWLSQGDCGVPWRGVPHYPAVAQFHKDAYDYVRTYFPEATTTAP